MNDNKAAKRLIKRAKSRPDLYSKADVIYARILRRRHKALKKLTKGKN